MEWRVLIFVISIALVQGDFNFSCPEDIIRASPPIVNASRYNYQVTINVAGKNQSIEAYEFSDMSNGTGSIKMIVHYTDATNSSIWITDEVHHDFNYNQTFIINRNGTEKTCRVEDFMHNETYSIFGWGIENGFKNPEYQYRWTGDYNYTFGNATVVNGIQAEKYSTCLLFNNSQVKYDVDLYFSANGWNTRSGENVPLMVVLKVNKTDDAGTTFTGETYTYTFASYQHDVSVDWLHDTSDTPPGVICEGRKDTIPPPSPWVDYGATEETVKFETKQILSISRFYNYHEKLYRADFVAPNKTPPRSHHYLVPGHHYTVIHDFHEGVEYFIDKSSGNCSVSKLTTSLTLMNLDVENDPTHPGFIRMRNIADFNKARNFTYTGRHTRRRGLTLDSWTSTVPYVRKWPNGSFTMDETIMTTTPDWSSPGGISPVPLISTVNYQTTANGTTTKGSVTVHLSRVTKHPGGNHMFDIGTCYNKETSRAFVLKFDSSYAKYIDQFSSVMNSGIQVAVAKAANISSVRVSSWSGKELASDASSGNSNPDQRLFVTVYLYGHPAVHGKTTEYTPSINLTKAVANLKATVEDNKLHVVFRSPTDNDTVTMTAFPDYFHELNSLYSPKPPAPAQGMSNGAIAGLCIGMILIGFIIGAVIVHVRYKRGNRQFGYSIQD